MRTKLGALVLIGLLVVGSLAWASPASAGGRVRTNITISGRDGDFDGRVSSDLPQCVVGRLVLLYRATSANGPFNLTGDQTNVGQDGLWSMPSTGERNGYYRVKAPRTQLCKAGRSKVRHLVNGVPQ